MKKIIPLLILISAVVFISDCVQQETGDGIGEAIEPADLTQLTFFEEEGRAVDPDWSPDGNQMVFCLVKEILEDAELYLINADGTVRMYYGRGPKKDEDGNVILDTVAGVYSAVRESI